MFGYSTQAYGLHMPVADAEICSALTSSSVRTFALMFKAPLVAKK
jgi:hypothetical protein